MIKLKYTYFYILVIFFTQNFLIKKKKKILKDRNLYISINLYFEIY